MIDESCFATFETSLLSEDPGTLTARFHRDGYLFFRNVLPAAYVEEVRNDVVGVLHGQGLVESNAGAPVWTGMGVEDVDDEPLYRLASPSALFKSAAFGSLYERLFG